MPSRDLIPLFSERQNRKRIESNYEILATEKKELQQVLTSREFEKYHPGIAHELKEFGIETKNVETVIQVKYKYKDSTRGYTFQRNKI